MDYSTNMNPKIVHEIENYLHQIIGHSEYIANNSDMSEYTEKIKSAVYKIDALISDATMQKTYVDIIDEDCADYSKYYGLNILVVDDLEANIKIMENIFNTFSCNIRSVLTGEEAIEIYKAGYCPDIVCMDIVMPGIDGLQTTKELKLLGCNAYFMAISALKNQTNEVVSLFDVWLPKPFTIEHIIGALSGFEFSNEIVVDEKEYILTSTSQEIKDELLRMANNGAYSELSKYISLLPDSLDKEFLTNQLKKLDFNSIIKSL